jgi:hypothetical protein
MVTENILLVGKWQVVLHNPIYEALGLVEMIQPQQPRPADKGKQMVKQSCVLSAFGIAHES